MSVFKRKLKSGKPSSTWTVSWYDANGKQKMKGGFRTQREAKAFEADIKTQLNKGTYVEPTKELLGSYLLNEWLPAVETELEPNTFVNVKAHLDRHIIPALGDIPIQRLTPEKIKAFYGGLLKKPKAWGTGTLSKTTVQRIHATLHKALETLVDSRRLAINPARKAKPRVPKSERKPEVRAWRGQELDAFLHHVADDDLFALWRLLSWTGLRRGEAAGLKWDDVDFEARTVAVRRAVGVASYTTHVTTPKSGQSRVIDLDDVTVRALRAHLRNRKALCLELGLPQPSSDSPVFVEPDGTPIHPQRISKLFDAKVRQTQLPRIRLHDLRHTHASLLIQSGANVKVVQERLGHSNVLTTLNTYAHLWPTTQREAVERLVGKYA